MKVYAPIPSAALTWGIDTQDITDDLTASCIAAVPALCTESYMYCYKDMPSKLDLSQFDLVMISDIEFYSLATITQWIQQQGIQRYILQVGGLAHNETIDLTNTVYRPWWVYNCLKFNKFEITQANNKPYQFEMLLGARRPHRDFAMLSFQQSGLLDSSIVTYRSVFQGHCIDQCSQQIAQAFAPVELEYPYISPNLDPAWEVSSNINYQISPFIPWEIYRRTNYSVLCETLGMGETFFMSEKAAKVLFGKRVFVAFAAQHYLKYLKQLGFQTFETVIDETYDNEPDYLKRYRQAFKQIQYLDTCNSTQLFEKLNPILEHNHHHLQVLNNQINQNVLQLVYAYL